MLQDFFKLNYKHVDHKQLVDMLVNIIIWCWATGGHLVHKVSTLITMSSSGAYFTSEILLWKKRISVNFLTKQTERKTSTAKADCETAWWVDIESAGRVIVGVRKSLSLRRGLQGSCLALITRHNTAAGRKSQGAASDWPSRLSSLMSLKETRNARQLFMIIIFFFFLQIGTVIHVFDVQERLNDWNY